MASTYLQKEKNNAALMEDKSIIECLCSIFVGSSVTALTRVRIRNHCKRIRFQHFRKASSDPDPEVQNVALKNSKSVWILYPLTRVSDPHWFNADADPDPAFFLIADPDSGSKVWWSKIEKKLQLQI